MANNISRVVEGDAGKREGKKDKGREDNKSERHKVKMKMKVTVE